MWVRWIQDLASAHWYAASPPEHRDAYIWVVTRHEIDYLRAVKEGETVTGRTWVEEPPRGARFDRHMEFTGEDGKARVRAKTTWAVLAQGDRPAAPRPAGGDGGVLASPALAGEGDHPRVVEG